MNDSKINNILNRSEVREQLGKKGINESEVLSQIERFNTGYPSVDVVRPCTVDDGIHRMDIEKCDNLVSEYLETIDTLKTEKFVPASGAASRMFRDLVSEYNLLKENPGSKTELESTEKLAGNIEKFAFYGDLKKELSSRGTELEELLQDRDYIPVLEALLNETGMNYSNLPKGIIKFHRYKEETRTAFEEHLVEAAKYLVKESGKAFIHFTVPEEYKRTIQGHLNEKKDNYSRGSVTYELDFSIQRESTDTIAVDLNNIPVLDPSEGTLVFRPGGHGALLENLNNIDSDIIFIKNIDNVLVQRHLDNISYYKMMLAGCLINVQRRLFDFLKRLQDDDDETYDEIRRFCSKTLYWKNISDRGMPPDQMREYYFKLLNRPLRVCGVVKNQGEPGGGPFWVRSDRGDESMQIVESAQIDMNIDKQRRVWESSTHFNPVDIVCGVKDYRGEKFDLSEFVDYEAGIITGKSLQGNDIKALELPGLWNGAMAKWITVFVEVPVETFSPVKTVFDLLREEHQGIL